MKTKIWILGAAALAAAASFSFAAETRIWSLGDRADFEKAKLKGLSLTSDGRLALAPVFKEVLDSASVYLWALAEDSKGNVYAGGGGPGGPGAKLYVIPQEGAGKSVASFEELEIHALAIDSKDQVYVGTAPDGKVYRMRGGKSETFYDPKAKYIWAMAFDRAGNLFVATGDGGEVHRVTPAGKGEVFYKSSETHARSMAIDPQGNLIVGTEPGGLIVRVDAKGQGFVLYQTAKREVTAVAVDREGAIWAAAVGTRQAPGAPAVSIAAVSVAAAPVKPAAGAAPATPHVAVQPAAPAPVAPASIPGGSEVYRIGPDGFPKRMWANVQDVVYSLGFDRDGRLLAGTGNNGKIYRIDSDLISTELVNAPPSQVTAILSGKSGRIWAATGNVGKVYRMGPETEKSGSAESEVFDAGLYSKWGRLTWRGQANGGRITFATRSGNLDRPQTDWSAWSGEIREVHGGPTSSPAARFVQWRADLTAAADGRSPVLNAVDVAYLPHNVAPVIRELETTPPNYRFPAPPSALNSTAQTLSLPALGSAAARPPTRQVTPAQIAPSMQAAGGFAGARWSASDENGDTLAYSIYIRGENETGWKLLAEKLAQPYYSWDSTAFPDGDYRIRVVASDAPDNPAGQALTAESVSEPFTIDNTPPVITGLAVTPSGNNLAMKWNARDALSVVEKAEYSINGSEWTPAPPVSGVSDSREEEYAITVERPAPGELTVAVRVTDEFQNRSVAKTVLK